MANQIQLSPEVLNIVYSAIQKMAEEKGLSVLLNIVSEDYIKDLIEEAFIAALTSITVQGSRSIKYSA
jgi:hypothetical protein